MGKLIKNGVEYGGSSNKAQAISYDNSTSGLSATTAQGAIDETNEKLNDKVDINHSHTKINTREYRPESANIKSDNRGAMEYFLASSRMTEGKPPFDGHIIHFNWDGGAGEYDTQIVFSNNPSHKQRMAIRRSDGSGNWEDWTKVLTAKDVTVSGTKLTINLD